MESGQPVRKQDRAYAGISGIALVGRADSCLWEVLMMFGVEYGTAAGAHERLYVGLRPSLWCAPGLRGCVIWGGYGPRADPLSKTWPICGSMNPEKYPCEGGRHRVAGILLERESAGLPLRPPEAARGAGLSRERANVGPVLADAARSLDGATRARYGQDGPVRP